MVQVIDFYADWCGPCKIMTPVLKELEKEYEGRVEFKELDVEVEDAMASEYGIMSIPTYVVLKDGKEVARRLGAMPKEVFKSWLDEQLK